MMYPLLKQLTEARDENLHYSAKEVKGKVEKLIVKLEGHQSASMTKLTKRYKSVDKAMKKVTAARDKLNADVKEQILSLYDAEDEIYTRVVETVTMTATLSKKPVEGTKVDYEKVVSGLLELMPELEDKIRELEAMFTSTVKAREAGLTIKVNEGVGDSLKKLRSLLKSFLGQVSRWAAGFDKKLAKLKIQLEV